MLAFICLSLSRVPTLSFNTCVILLIDIDSEDNDENHNKVPVIVLGFVSGFLGLGIFVCLVYHKRRVSGMVRNCGAASVWGIYKINWLYQLS